MRKPGSTAGLAEGAAGRVAALLRRGPMTVEQLATALGLTRNGVRAQLARLERAGLVHRTGTRPGVTRPSAEYALSPDGELLFSRAYAPVLAALVRALAHEYSSEQLGHIFRRAGRELRGEREQPAGDAAERARAASEVLNALGGLTVVERVDDRWQVRGEGCPLSAVTRGHPEACTAVESLLGEIVNARVTSCCEHGGRLACCFDVSLPEGDASPAARPPGRSR
ncbi:MAG TPA: helix-turn-helix domain-containing protein [Gemmatimonadaceae bacterium]|nr:helix-turn-helix domain-containing protein [Gemmatimonadaceae bacterium]